MTPSAVIAAVAFLMLILFTALTAIVMPEGHDADAFRKVALENFKLNLTQQMSGQFAPLVNSLADRLDERAQLDQLIDKVVNRGRELALKAAHRTARHRLGQAHAPVHRPAPPAPPMPASTR